MSGMKSREGYVSLADAEKNITDLTEDREGEDWPKRNWTLPAKNVEELRAYLRRTGTPIEVFKQQPIYKWAVANMHPKWILEL